MSAMEELEAWAKKNRPELLGVLRTNLKESVSIMNKITGLNESAWQDVESLCAKFVRALKTPASANTEAATKAERERIRAALQDLKPPHRPRTHGDWARGWKEAGELAMFDRVMAALDAPAKKGGE